MNSMYVCIYVRILCYSTFYRKTIHKLFMDKITRQKCLLVTTSKPIRIPVYDNTNYILLCADDMYYLFNLVTNLSNTCLEILYFICYVWLYKIFTFSLFPLLIFKISFFFVLFYFFSVTTGFVLLLLFFLPLKYVLYAVFRLR